MTSVIRPPACSPGCLLTGRRYRLPLRPEQWPGTSVGRRDSTNFAALGASPCRRGDPAGWRTLLPKSLHRSDLGGTLMEESISRMAGPRLSLPLAGGN
jgi:hypothetical protein